MSGTSLDGLDMVLVDFERKDGVDQFSLVHHKHVPYLPILLEEIRACIYAYLGKYDEKLHRNLGEFYADCAYNFLREKGVNADFIANHGQTVYHEPSLRKTIQLGDAQVIADVTGVPVYFDFRSADVEMGGQGAPLVPIGDLNLFPEYKYCLNLGGIANVSLKEHSSVVAFDICTCNVGLNYYASQFGVEYDDGGELGKRGKVNKDLLKKWNNLSFYKKESPKSLDAGFFHREMLPLVDEGISLSDQLSTYYEHISFQISGTLGDKQAKCLTTGGGAHNAFLMDHLQAKSKARLVLPGEDIIDFKEAIIFAYLAFLRAGGEVNVLSNVTGAPEDHSAGRLAVPFK